MLVDIGKITVKDRIRRDFGDIGELAEDIRQNGLINPPVVNRDYQLLAGERRLRACRSLGWEQIEVRMMDTRDAEHELNVEISENEVRKEFSKAERVDYMKRLLLIEQAKAKERQESFLKQNSSTVSQNSDERSRADEIVSAQFNVSRDTLRKELSIVDNRDLLTPEDFADWDEGRLSTNKAFLKIKKEQEALMEENRKLKAENDSFNEAADVIRGFRKLADTGIVTADLAQEVMDNLTKEEREAVIGRENGSADKIKQQELEIKELQRDNDRYAEDNARITGELLELRKKYDSLTGDELNVQVGNKFKVFIGSVADFMTRAGGYVWITEHFHRLTEKDKAECLRALKDVEDWVSQMKYNIANNKEVIE